MGRGSLRAARGRNAGTEGAGHIRGDTQKPGCLAPGPERED